MAAFDLDVIEDEDQPGRPSGFSCPDCGGTLREIQDGELMRFRCRVGHAWTANGLVAEQGLGIETAMWTALRALEERAALCSRVAERMSERGLDISAVRFRQQAADSKRRAAVLRQVLVSVPTTSDEPGPTEETAPTVGDTQPGEAGPNG